jgi:hypothetical protein
MKAVRLEGIVQEVAQRQIGLTTPPPTGGALTTDESMKGDNPHQNNLPWITRRRVLRTPKRRP